MGSCKNIVIEILFAIRLPKSQDGTKATSFETTQENCLKNPSTLASVILLCPDSDSVRINDLLEMIIVIHDILLPTSSIKICAIRIMH